MLKAYFPNLIAKKEVSVVSPISSSLQRDAIGHHSNSAKERRPKNAFPSNHSSGPRFIDANLVMPGDFSSI